MKFEIVRIQPLAISPWLISSKVQKFRVEKDFPINQSTNYHLTNLVVHPCRVAINSRKVKTLPYIYPINQSPINQKKGGKLWLE
jgi:hypothetical protein